jgi:hypothetical protein
MMLVQSTKDFQSLIDRLHVQKEFEQATKEGDRFVFQLSLTLTQPILAS